MVSPLNPLYTERELQEVLQKSEAEIAVVLAPFYKKVKNVQPETIVRKVITVNIKTFLPPLLRFLFTIFKERKEGYRPALQEGDMDFDAFLKKGRGAAPPQVTVKPDDPAILMFTGGTTGSPKAALGLHRHLVISGMQYKAWLTNVLIDWDDTIMALMPLFHIYGLAGVMATGIIGHHPLALVPNPRDLDDVIATIGKEKPAFLPGVPTLFNAMLNHPKVKSGKANLKSLKLCICGAAPLLLEIKKRFEKVTGGKIIEGYALTESMMAGAFTPVYGKYKPGSVGLPNIDVEIKIVDADKGEKELPPKEVGEVIMRAPQLMKEYWKNPEETANTIKNGWLFTGDLGYMDEEGFLYIVDRKKDLIKPSGFQVWPREVEEVIASHPAVQEVGVAGVPDERQGEAVKAWVVIERGKSLTAEELRNFCRERLTGYKVPKHIEFCDELPKSAVGKILRRELRKKESKEMHMN